MYGGAEGVRDLGQLEAALFRPQSGYYRDIIAEAAALWESLAQNHPFVDGNKRVAWVTARLFLLANGRKLVFEPFDAIRIMESAAAGRVSEQEVASWFRVRLAA